MMRWWSLVFLVVLVFGQAPPTIIFVPSEQSVNYANRPIATGPVAVNLPAVAVAGLPAGVNQACLAALPAGQMVVTPASQTCNLGCDPAFVGIPLNAAGQMTLGAWPQNFLGQPQIGIGAATARAWTAGQLELLGPRLLCAGTAGGAVQTPVTDGAGRRFFVQTAFDCNPATVPVGGVVPNAGCTSANRIAQVPANAQGSDLALLLGQTQCCTLPATAGTQIFPFPVGVCINPNQQTCCGNRPVTTGAEQCCSATTASVPLVNTLQQSCPCGGLARNDAGAPILALACPANQQCCRRTKFNNLASNPGATGFCFDPAHAQCCDTGDVYDSAVQQCCPINGIQSANVPCPCGTDADCQSSAFLTAAGTPGPVRKTMGCCRQTAPPVAESLTCTAFDNFPSGVGTVQAQRCAGFCIDLRYQICCNGVACLREYEKCCNNTCCNTFVGTCAIGFRPGALGNRWSSREFEVPYEQCTTIEVTTTINVFWIYILPTALLLATLLGFAIALAFLNIAARGRLSLLEKLIVFFAVFALLCACLLFFAPVYKYGILTVLVCLLAIITAAARVRWLNIVFVIATLALGWYLIDPLNGNDYWGVGYRRLNTGKPDPATAGMWLTTGSLWHNVSQVNDASNWCVDFYDYFRYDPALRDEQRLHNPVVTTFGYCSRGWVFALLIMEGFIHLSLFLLFLLGLLALLLRFRPMTFDPVEIEIINA